MKALNKIKSLVFVVLISIAIFGIGVSKAYAYSNPSAVSLLTVANFASLAKTEITSPTGLTTINNGDVGIASPGTCTDFASPCSAPNVNGIIVGGALQFQNSAATTGQTDATSLVTDLNLRASNATLLSQLGGQTLTQGVYDVPAASTNLTGDLTLTGDANSIFIFRASSTLVTDTASRVVLTGGVQSCNVFWTVGSSATFNGTTSMVGTVLAANSVTFPGGAATVNGRLIAQTAAITFNNTTINNTSCANTSIQGSSSNSSAGSAPQYFCPTITLGVIAPIIIESKRIDKNSVFLSWGPYSGTDKFNVRYGIKNGEWLYNTDVTGFSITVKSLPDNQPIWVQVAARNECQIGTYEVAKLVGGPKLPISGFSPQVRSKNLLLSLILYTGIPLLIILRNRKYLIFP